MSKHSKFATISVAVFVGLLAVYLGVIKTARTRPSTPTHSKPPWLPLKRQLWRKLLSRIPTANNQQLKWLL